MNEIEELRNRISELEFKLNQFVKPDVYSFPRAMTTRLGTKLSFYGATPIQQPSSSGEGLGHFPGGGTNVQHADQWGGNVGTTHYTTSDIVKHLKNLGILAM